MYQLRDPSGDDERGLGMRRKRPAYMKAAGVTYRYEAYATMASRRSFPLSALLPIGGPTALSVPCDGEPSRQDGYPRMRLGRMRRMRLGPDIRWEELIMAEGGHSALPSPNLVQEHKERSIR